jgi:hypothetical protein
MNKPPFFFFDIKIPKWNEYLDVEIPDINPKVLETHPFFP